MREQYEVMLDTTNPDPILRVAGLVYYLSTECETCGQDFIPAMCPDPMHQEFCSDECIEKADATKERD